MGFSVNKVTIVGKLGGDPETRFTTANVSITTFNVATDHSYKNKSTDEWVNETTWHRAVAFNLSDFHKQTLAKGVTVYFEGRITRKEYTDKEGVKRYNTDLLIDNSSLIVFGKGQRVESDSPKQPSKQSAPEDNDDLPF